MADGYCCNLPKETVSYALYQGSLTRCCSLTGDTFVCVSFVSQLRVLMVYSHQEWWNHSKDNGYKKCFVFFKVQ